MSRHFARLMLVVFVVAAPSVTSAQSGQSAIAGVVRDSTGAVLPGVTVEASSPALIEKSRSAVSDEAGQYRVVDLRPGTYRITFTLQGFTTVIRDGIVLESNFVAPVNVDMTVGGVEQAITVTGESPIVDVQSSQRRDVVNSEMLEALPTGRSFVTMAGTVPAVSTGQFDVGGSTAMWQGGSLTVHGSLNVDSRTLIDGMIADAMFAGGQCSCVYDNEAQTQEIAVQISAGSAENQLSGVLVNRVPRTGGNMGRGRALSIAGGLIWLSVIAPAIEAEAPREPVSVAQRPTSAQSSPRVFLDTYCVTCHNQRLKTADLTLDVLDPSKPSDHAAVWETVLRKVRTKTMPPQAARQPDGPAAASFVAAIESALDDASRVSPDPGRTPAVRRLNRTEYKNVVRDLLALDDFPKEMDISLLLPPDDIGEGFDNMARMATPCPVWISATGSSAAHRRTLNLPTSFVAAYLERRCHRVTTPAGRRR